MWGTKCKFPKVLVWAKPPSWHAHPLLPKVLIRGTKMWKLSCSTIMLRRRISLLSDAYTPISLSKGTLSIMTVWLFPRSCMTSLDSLFKALKCFCCMIDMCHVGRACWTLPTNVVGIVQILVTYLLHLIGLKPKPFLNVKRNSWFCLLTFQGGLILPQIVGFQQC
jgi:hypothetical protein